MAVALDPTHGSAHALPEHQCPATVVESPSTPNLMNGIDITRIPTEPDAQGENVDSRFILHVYSKHDAHKCISPTTDLTKERWSGPTPKEQKSKRKEKKQRKKSGSLSVDIDENAFFLHRPYLAFHVPPRVLYAGNTKHARPVVLIHTGMFWKEYKIQFGPSLAKPGVLDPRGVVSWKHNGGNSKALKADDRKLKGYKVRTWRLWGENGKDYVHSVKKNRQAKEGPDPDVLENDDSETLWPQIADEVVYLRWTNPLSPQTRTYHFQYAGLEFQWKGTGTVKESRTCGMLLRFNHLKLVAKLPAASKEEEQSQLELCLVKYTSSVATKKNGSLEFYHTAILRLVEDHIPWMLARSPFLDQDELVQDNDSRKIVRLKKSTLYHVIVATAMCMITSEKEKRHTLLDILIQAAEGGGGGGGGGP